MLRGDRHLPDGSYSVLTVADTGVGIDPADLESVFDPFFTTKDVGFGTGLGLSMVYSLVQQADGDVRIESIVDVGTSVSILLPAGREADSRHADSRRMNDDDVIDGGAVFGGRVLLVEDNEKVRRVTSEMLTRLGFVVTSSHDAKSALACMEPGQCRMCLTDVMLPGSDGLTLADDLCARDPELKVMLMSGYTDLKGQIPPSDRDRFPMLSKPFRFSELQAALHSLLSD